MTAGRSISRGLRGAHGFRLASLAAAALVLSACSGAPGDTGTPGGGYDGLSSDSPCIDLQYEAPDYALLEASALPSDSVLARAFPAPLCLIRGEEDQGEGGVFDVYYAYYDLTTDEAVGLIEGNGYTENDATGVYAPSDYAFDPSVPVDIGTQIVGKPYEEQLLEDVFAARVPLLVRTR